VYIKLCMAESNYTHIVDDDDDDDDENAGRISSGTDGPRCCQKSQQDLQSDVTGWWIRRYQQHYVRKKDVKTWCSGQQVINMLLLYGR